MANLPDKGEEELHSPPISSVDKGGEELHSPPISSVDKGEEELHSPPISSVDKGGEELHSPPISSVDKGGEELHSPPISSVDKGGEELHHPPISSVDKGGEELHHPPISSVDKGDEEFQKSEDSKVRSKPSKASGSEHTLPRWCSFLKELRGEVENTLKLCRTTDFEKMNENTFKVAVLASIKQLAQRSDNEQEEGKPAYRTFFEEIGEPLVLEHCVQSERRVNVIERSPDKKVARVRVCYIDILILPPNVCVKLERDAPISRDEMKGVGNNEAVVIELKYVPLTYLYYKPASSSGKPQPVAATSPPLYKLSNPIEKRKKYGEYADNMKKETLAKDFAIDKLQFPDPGDKDHHHILLSDQVKKAMDQARRYARALPVAQDTRIIVAALVGYGPKVCLEIEDIRVLPKT